ncbi:MAG: LIC11966 family surface protein [Bacteroidia bacterium]
MANLFKNLLFTFILFSLNPLVSQTAVAYMDKMGKEFNKISEETWDYTRAVAHGKKARQIENQRKQMLEANRSALTRIKNMQPYNGDASYRDSTVRYLEMSYAVLNYDYSKIVDMEEISEQSYDAMEAYMMAQQKANEKLDAAFAVASDAQKSFAKNNNITLLGNESKTEEKLDKAGEVFKFYNKIYLIFFKPYKQELYLIEAQGKGDINAMKQNQEALAKLSKEAKEKLKDIGSYNGNTTLKSGCSDVLDFYVMEAETKVPQLVDFYLKKEKFEKLKIAMDKKGKNSSNEEINEFNTAVNDYNKSINDYNAVNNDLNKKRSEALETWNNAVSKFLDKNVSKKK